MTSLNSYYIIYICCLAFLSPTPLDSQSPVADSIAKYIFVDTTLTITAPRVFNTSQYIDYVMSDKSLFLAFQNLRTLQHDLNLEFIAYKKSGKRRGKWSAWMRQHIHGLCRWSNMLSEERKGRVFKEKRKGMKFITGRIFRNIFITEDTTCISGLDTTRSFLSQKKPVGKDRYILGLKQLIFAPGHEVDLPIVRARSALFDENQLQYYNFQISRDSLNDKHPAVIVFEAHTPDIPANFNKTIIKEFTTTFDMVSMQVLERAYRIQLKQGLISCDVAINIELDRMGKMYVPRTLSYEGYWNIPGRYPEIAKIRARFSNFQ